MTDERELILDALRESAKRESEEHRRHLAEVWALHDELAGLLLRGKDAGLTDTAMAEALHEETGVTRQRVTVMRRHAEEAATGALDVLLSDARADELMRDSGISADEARKVVQDERLAARRAEFEANVAALVAFSREVGSGAYLSDEGASFVLWRVQKGGWSEARLAREVAFHLYGSLGNLDDREAFGRRLIAFARSNSTADQSDTRGNAGATRPAETGRDKAAATGSG